MSYDPRPILIRDVSADCSMCDEPISGLLLIELADEYLVTAEASGSILDRCNKHHSTHKEPGKDIFPNHDVFSLHKGGARIGEIVVASGVSRVGIEIQNGEVQRTLSDIARAYRGRERE